MSSENVSELERRTATHADLEAMDGRWTRMFQALSDKLDRLSESFGQAGKTNWTVVLAAVAIFISLAGMAGALIASNMSSIRREADLSSRNIREVVELNAEWTQRFYNEALADLDYRRTRAIKSLELSTASHDAHIVKSIEELRSQVQSLSDKQVSDQAVEKLSKDVDALSNLVLEYLVTNNGERSP